MFLTFILFFVGIMTPLSSLTSFDIYTDWSTVKGLLEQVAVTACVPDGYYSYPSKVPFTAIKSQTGPIDSNALKNGDFICPTAGLYMVTFTLSSESYGASFIIYKNDNQVTSHLINDAGNRDDSGTSVIALELNVNDIVSVKPTKSKVHFADAGSCLTILKINNWR